MHPGPGRSDAMAKLGLDNQLRGCLSRPCVVHGLTSKKNGVVLWILGQRAFFLFP